MSRFTKALAMAVCIAGCIGMFAGSAGATDAGSEETGWSFAVSPYVWVSALKGTVATLSGLPKVDVDLSMSDVLDHTDLAVMVQGEARFGRIGFLTDVVYTELSGDESTPGPLFGGVDLKADTLILGLAMFYRALERDRATLDLLGGVRIWDIDTTLKLKPGLALGRKVQDRQSWGDPLVGARGRIGLLGPTFFSAEADIGGFGAGSALSWQAVATLDYDPWEWLSLRAGYRHLDVDYDHHDFVWDVYMSGPILGASLRF